MSSHGGYWRPGLPPAVSAECPTSMVEELLAFDHHVVEVDGVRGILITYPWHSEPVPEGRRREAMVLLNPSERHLQTPGELCQAVDGHPDAPGHVQQLVDSLHFAPCGIPWQE